MKKFLTITVIVLSMMVFVACGGSSKKEKIDPTDEPTSEEPTSEEPTSDEPTSEEPTDATDDEGCTGLSLDWSQFTHYQTNTFYLTDEDTDPVLQMQFYQDEETGAITAGTYDLGSESNSSYATCTECVYMLADYVEAEGDEENGSYSKIYYQKRGSLTVEKVDDSNNIVGTITATLAEATIEDSTFETNFVEGGACYKIETASFDSGYEEPCVPQCDGKECGSDGCGGACGTCEGQACSAEFKCVPFNCDKLEVEEFEIATVESWFSSYNRYEAYVKDNKPGSAEIPDLLTMTFYTYDAEEDEWSYKTELLEGTETLASYEDDETAIIMYEDYDVENESVGKYYVHESGKLNITKVKEGTLESQGNGSFRVMEVDTDLIQVPGGKCYEFKDITWDTICVPKCEGKVCGPDGCGGTCGEGCGADKTCNADQTQCVDFNCTEITFETGSYNSEYGLYLGKYTPNTTDDDLYLLETWTGESDTYDLSGTNYKDCDLCFVIYEGEDTRYFQQKGTVVFSTQESATGTNVTAKVSGLRLEQVTIAGNYTSTPVPGGACYDVKDTTITYTVEEEDDYDYGD